SAAVSCPVIASFKIQTCLAVLWALMLVLSVAIYGSHAPLLTLCKVDGRIPFSASSVVVLIELTKLGLSLVSLLIWDRRELGVSLSWHHAAPFALSALLYAANNNLVVHMQLFMDPSTYQVLSNLKIGSTALLYSLFLRQRLSLHKWLALFLLTAAGMSYTYGGLQDFQPSSSSSEMQLHITLSGLLLISPTSYPSLSSQSTKELATLLSVETDTDHLH
uniref:Solute carrier family 35 member A4 n=1 Tax=Pelusios castaneus TaxID=367368 RepID=A0A8C8SQP7_9SAUR